MQKKKNLKHSKTESDPMQLYKTQNSVIHTYLKFTVTSLDMACMVYKITVTRHQAKQPSAKTAYFDQSAVEKQNELSLGFGTLSSLTTCSVIQ
jgi:hypothetical protein